MRSKFCAHYAFLLITLLVSACATRQTGDPFPGSPVDWTREELFFGLNKPDGSQVTNSEFEAFITREVSSRLCCFTVLQTTGYYTSTPGAPAVQEPGRVLMVMYDDNQKDIAVKLSAIAQSYVRTFSQESVLRVAARVRVHFVK
jgi:hypothetical protein